MTIVEKVKESIPDSCFVPTCGTKKCKLDLRGLPMSRVVVDMDCEDLSLQNTPHCDYLIIIEGSQAIWVVPIEIKDGKVDDPSHIASQLNGGAQLAERSLPIGIGFKLLPVLVHAGSVTKFANVQFKRKTVNLRGQVRKIDRLKCGSRLATLLS